MDGRMVQTLFALTNIHCFLASSNATNIDMCIKALMQAKWNHEEEQCISCFLF